MRHSEREESKEEDGKKNRVLGTGANGAAIGADLTRAGLDVVLIDQWPENVAAMRERGVRVEMPGEVLTVPVRAFNLCDVCTFRDPFDIVLMLVKAYDSRWAAQLIEPYLKSDGLLVGVQNGMTTQTIAEVVGRERTLGCVIEISSSMMVPGVSVRDSNHERSWFAVGPNEGDTKAHANEIAELLRHVGKVSVVDNVQATILPSTKTTVLQDWMKGRHSEVNDLNGTVVDEAKRLGLKAPVNAAIVEMALEIENGRLKPDPGNIRRLAERVRELSGEAAPSHA